MQVVASSEGGGHPEASPGAQVAVSFAQQPACAANWAPGKHGSLDHSGSSPEARTAPYMQATLCIGSVMGAFCFVF